MHVKLTPGWTSPAAPAKYPDLTAIKLNQDFSIRWEMGFSRLGDGEFIGRYFASDAAPWNDDAKSDPIAWPWVQGFEPIEADWTAIGFIVLDMRDLDSEIRPSSDLEIAVRAHVQERLFDIDAKKAGVGLLTTGSA